MIPTPPSPSDIPTGPKRPTPTRAPPPPIARDGSDEFEALRRSVEELRTRLLNLETRVAALEGRVRAP